MAKSDPAGFGGRLRRWRESTGLTQRQLAHRLGYHHTLISKIESGDRRPPRPLRELLKIGDAAPLELGPTPEMPRTRQVRLPSLGIICPEHGHTGCTATTLDVDTVRADEATVHGLAASLVDFTDTNLQRSATGTVVAVEWCLRLIKRLLDEAAGASIAVQLRHLAAQYAHLAGWLRVERGQRGLGMLWFDRGARWGRTSGSTVATCECLARMSLVARLERDARSAVAYGEAIRRAGRGRSWTEILAEIHVARGYAVDGDHVAIEQHAQKVRGLLTDAVIDPVEAPWLCGAEGRSFVESSVAAGFRDLAALSGDDRAANTAIRAAHVALDNVSSRLRPSEILLTLRLADTYACAGQPDAAVATAGTVLADAAAAGTTLIGEELRGLRGRLLRRWGNLAEVSEFDARLRTELAR